MHNTEILITGAGIVGLTMARELLKHGADRITIIDKEPGLGFHASGRNSGVLHSGIYYPPETLKAKLCLKGNLMMQEYCRANNLPLVNAGKVIVAADETELPTLHRLYERAKENGVKVDLVDEQQLAEIEPNAKTVDKAIFSHYTALIDNRAILDSLFNELQASGRVDFMFKTAFNGLDGEFVAKTSVGNIKFNQFINAAGSYADKVAHHFGVGQDYYFIPFKGIYQKLDSKYSHLVNGNIYPVPNLQNPFLGVHFTKNIHGNVYVGPTAIPAFGRENYGILQGVDREAFRILLNEAKLFFTNAQFRQVALTEPRKYLSTFFYQDARRLVKELRPEWLSKTSKAGIRPQLISLRDGKLVMDFMVVRERHSVHILNAISPAFTSSMAFAEYVVQEYFSNQKMAVNI